MQSLVISKLARCRLLALLSGFLFSYILAFLGAVVASATNNFASPLGPWELLVLRMGIILMLAILLAFGLAVILGAYDLLVLGAFAVPALLYFAAQYSMDIFIFLPDKGGFYDVFGAEPPIYWRGQLNVGQHLWVLFSSLAWGLVTACAGVALKRGLLRPKLGIGIPILSPSATRSLWSSLIFDVGLLFLIVFIGLGIDQVHRAAMRPHRGPWSENFDRRLETSGRAC